MKEVNGLVQHSFALQLTDPHRPFRGRTTHERLRERFSLDTEAGPYSLMQLAEVEDLGARCEREIHSSLARAGLTTVGSLQMNYLKHTIRLPSAFDWSIGPCTRRGPGHEMPQLIFADKYDHEGQATINDFWVSAPSADPRAAEVSRALLELMAHMRSRLFGFALANRFVNVMLPHALLQPTRLDRVGRAWLMQPLVSLIRGGRDRGRLRSTYCLTLFFVPVEETNVSLRSRKMSKGEIRQIVDAGWSYATARRSGYAEFDLSGPLLGYLSRLARFDLYEMRQWTPPAGVPNDTAKTLTLRKAAERVAFGVGLALAQGKSGDIGKRASRLLGNEVIMALGGSARVSSVVVVDPTLKEADVEALPKPSRPFPGKLLPLMRELAKPARIAERSGKEVRRHRIDRPFVDDPLYAAGVLPSKRCTIVVSVGDAQCGIRESALMQAGSVAYMTIGAATAIGTMRAIDRRVESLEVADPTEVAEIDREIAADLNEIYDLDITREAYREVYRRLRTRLGIKRDYETLRDEMQTLYRATSTFHEHKAEQLLTLLTAAIVILSVFILIGTIVLIAKPGG